MTDQAPPPRTFAALLTALDDGRLHSELTDELKEAAQELVRYAISNGGKAKGSLTLTLELTAADDNTLFIKGMVKTKTPPEPAGRTITWLGEDNNLHLSNPKQIKTGVREVPAPAAARGVAGPAAAEGVAR